MAESLDFRELLYRRMLAQANLVAALSDHPTLVGSGRERALAELLRELIPRRYEVLTGTVLLDGGKGHTRSPQIDLMIVDTLDYPAVLRAGDVAVVLPEAVRVIIEVKSDLENVRREDGALKQGETFLKAVEQVGRVADLFEPEASVFSGLVSYAAPARSSTLRAWLKDVLEVREQRWRELQRAREGDRGSADIRGSREQFSALSADNLPSIIVADDGAIARRISAAAGSTTSAPRYQFLRLAERKDDVRGASILALVDAVLEHLYLTMLVGPDLPSSGGLKRAFQRLSVTVGPRLEPVPGCDDLPIGDPPAPGQAVLVD